MIQTVLAAVPSGVVLDRVGRAVLNASLGLAHVGHRSQGQIQGDPKESHQNHFFRCHLEQQQLWRILVPGSESKCLAERPDIRIIQFRMVEDSLIFSF